MPGFKKGLSYQRQVRGHPRRFHLHLIVSAQLQYALIQVSRIRGQSKSRIVEAAVWRELGRLTARDKGKIIERMKYVDRLITEIITLVSAVEVAGTVKVAGRAPDVHVKETRRERRNELSEKVHAATNQVFDLAQSEALAQESQTRAVMYGVLAQLANVDMLILKDAAEEEILEAVAELRKEQAEFEEATRKLEAEAEEDSGKKS